MSVASGLDSGDGRLRAPLTILRPLFLDGFIEERGWGRRGRRTPGQVHEALKRDSVQSQTAVCKPASS